jgi:LPS-assembly lipoprotein
MKPGFSILMLGAALALLAACGFQPVYGTHSTGDESVSTQMNSVAIGNIPDRIGQMLRNDLIDRMYGKGRPQQALYNLSVQIRMAQADLGIQANATSTRSMIDMYGDYVLTDTQGRALIKGTAHSISSYSTLADEYGNLAALNDAKERTVNEVSEQIVNRLSLYFAEKDEGHTPPPPAATAFAVPQAVPVTIPNAVSLTPNVPPTPNTITTPTAGSQPAAASSLEPTGGPLPDPRLAPTF